MRFGVQMLLLLTIKPQSLLLALHIPNAYASTARAVAGWDDDRGHSLADNLTIADSGNGGITIRTGSTSIGAIYFSDAGGSRI